MQIVRLRLVLLRRRARLILPTIAVDRGTGDRTQPFAAGWWNAFGVQFEPAALAVGDLNDDGRLDFAHPNIDGALTLFVNTTPDPIEHLRHRLRTLRILFGDTVSITLVVATEDEAATGAWVDSGRERLAAAIAQLESILPDEVREQRDAARLLGELRKAELTADGRAASVRATLTGATEAAVRAIAAAWFAR